MPHQDGLSSQLLPGIGAPQPPPPAGMPSSMPPMDPNRLAALLSTQPPPQPNNIPLNTGMPGFPMLPALSGTPPGNVDFAQLHKQLMSQGIPLPQNLAPQNFSPVPGTGGIPGLQGSGTPDNAYGR
jgi:polyadenylation factor subunit 2